MSIRTRLAIAIALVLLVTVTLLGLAVVRNTRAALIGQLDGEVKSFAAREAAEKPARGRRYDGPADSGAYGRVLYNPIAYYVFDADGTVARNEPCVYAGVVKPAPDLPPITGGRIAKLLNRVVSVPSTDGTLRYRMLVQRINGDQIAVSAAPLTAVDNTIARLVRIVFLVGVLALVTATVACWWLIRIGLRPVDRMVDTAAAIAAGDLGRRVPDANPRTELGQLGGALNEMLVQIEGALDARAASESRLRRFVADAAHELRTPLTSLRGYAELYRQGALPDEAGVANAMGRIESEGARMSRLVDDLLLLARLDQQRGLEPKPVDLVDLAREAIADFGAVDPNRPITADLVPAAIVAGDRTRLRQILDNLLANARTHTPPGTPVHVSVTRHPDRVEVPVADDGPGIPPEAQARVFERFWRADPARARSRGGTGLGLAIVASLVEAHGGTVAVANRPTGGAVFTVRLPLAPPAAAPSAPAAPRSPMPASAS